MPPHPGLSPHAHALASHALVSSAPKADHSTLDHNHRFVVFSLSVSLAASEHSTVKPDIDYHCLYVSNTLGIILPPYVSFISFICHY